MNANVQVDDRTSEATAFEHDLVAVSEAAIQLARSLGRSPEAAAEVVQEAATLAWRYRSTRRGPWRPWFLAIVYRAARRPVIGWLPLPAGWDQATLTWPGEALPDPLLRKALDQLPARQRAALLLRYREDMSVDDVSRVMRISEGAAKQLLARARAGLRHGYQQLESETR